MACRGCGAGRGGGGFWANNRPAATRAANPVRMAPRAANSVRIPRITNAARSPTRFTNALRAMRLWPARRVR